MKKLFKWLLLLASALAICVVILLYNPALVKGPLERYLSNLTGYPVSLRGELSVDIGSFSEFTITDIHVAAPQWASHEDLKVIKFLAVKLDTGSLFEDIIVLESLQIEGLQLNLETDTNGAGNWLSANPPAPDTGTEAAGPVVIVRESKVVDSAFRFLNGKTGVNEQLRVSAFNQQQVKGILRFGLDGSFNDRSVNYSGEIGPYENLLKGQNISFSGKGQFGTLDITTSGLIDKLAKPQRPRFDLEIQGPDIDEITEMFGVDDLGSGGFSLVAKGAEVNDQYNASINGSIGDVSLDISARASDLSKLNEVDLNLLVNGPSLGAFTRAFGVEKWPDKPFLIKGDIERIGRTLNVSGLTLNIGGARLALDALLSDFPSLEASRIKLLVSGDDVAQFRDLLGVSGVATGPFEIKGQLDVSPTMVELLQVELQTSLGRITLSGSLGAAPSYTGSKFHLHLQGNNAHTLMSAFEIDVLPERPFSLDTRVEIVEKGMLVERGVLVTIDDERLELGGFVAFSPGSQGTDVELRFQGQQLSKMLQHLISDASVPNLPYDLSGRVRVVEQGFQLENVKAEFADIDLTALGLINIDDGLLGTEVDFQVNGEDLSSLSIFPGIGDSMEIFATGQSYRATGHFSVENNGWRFKGIEGRIGETDINLDGRISNQARLSGSTVQFSINGPGLDGLLADRVAPELLNGSFSSAGQVSLQKDTLNITGFSIDTADTQGKIDLALDWPLSDGLNADFNVDIRGKDIRQVIPPTGSFELDLAPYELKALGTKQGDMVALDHFDLSIGNLEVSMKGALDEKTNGENLNIVLTASSGDISVLGRLNGDRLPAQALNIAADFKGNASQFRVNNLSGSLGDSQLNGSLDVSLRGARPDIKLVLNSKYIDTRPYLKTPDPDEDTKPGAKSDRLIPATPLPLDILSAADMNIKLSIAELELQKIVFKNLSLEAGVLNGGLNIPKFYLEGPRGRFNTSVTIDPTDASNADVSLNFNAENFILNFLNQPEDKLHQVPVFDTQGSFKGKGSNLQELAGSLNGSFYLGSEGGILEGVNLSILDTFILDEIFSLILPKSDTKNDLNLSCAATILKITDGLVKTSPGLAFTTDQVALVAKGTLDLKTEKMNFNFNATPNKALKISASELFNPYILVGGTLAKPSVGLDPGKVLIHGGAAIGTAGISILAKGVIDRVSNTAPLCEQMLKREEPGQ